MGCSSANCGLRAGSCSKNMQTAESMKKGKEDIKMGKKLCTTAIGLAFLAFFPGCGGIEEPEDLGSPVSASQKGKNPFHWVGSAAVQLQLPMSFCPIDTPDGVVWGAIVVGTGTLSGQHIAKNATFTSSECASPTSPYFSGGLMTITTKQGDSLNIEYHGTCGYDSATEMTCQEVDEIVGGTGRFADAKGSATGVLKAFFTYDSSGNLIMPWSAYLEYTGKGSF
jgi:hypothetical protein